MEKETRYKLLLERTKRIKAFTFGIIWTEKSHLDRHLRLIFLIMVANHSLNSVRKELNLD